MVALIAKAAAFDMERFVEAACPSERPSCPPPIRPPPQKKTQVKRKHEDSVAGEEEERCVSVIASLLRNVTKQVSRGGLGWAGGARSLCFASACLGGLLPCSNPLLLTLPSHPPSTQARRDRVAAKFVEAEFEKCDRLLEAYLRHEGRVAAEEERCAESCLGAPAYSWGACCLHACLHMH